MKKQPLFFVFLVSLFIVSSCSHTLYPTETLEYNYNMRMKTDEELQAKAQVRIFLSEQDVKGDYSVISFNLYSPFRLPIFMSYKKQMSKKFFQKAVMKAYEQGGNGIIITAGGYYKVIKIANWDSDNEQAATFINVIYDKKIMNRFANGEVSEMSKSDVKRYESMFTEEIFLNLKSATTLEETSVIREKISVLESYNQSLSKPKTKISKDIDDMEKSLTKLEKKINKRIEKENR